MELRQKIINLCEEYGHPATSYGVQCILNEWQSNKGWLIDLFKQHPNYQEGKYRIVFSSDYNRAVDKDGVERFVKWAQNEFDNILISRQILSPLRNWEYKIFNTIAVTKDDYNLRHNLHCILRLLIDLMPSVVTSDFAEKFHAFFPDIPCAEGTRITKVFRRLCIKLGLDKVVNMQDCGHHDANGNWIPCMRDKGYNYQIAALGDAINPLKIKRHTIISLNPLDYLTMSFGNSWASCHTIDKENTRNRLHSYEGQYCSGTLSYMLDPSSIVFYTVDSAYDGDNFEEEDKINRCMFHVGSDGDVMIQGRVYPDGRDGGDKSLSAQFREVMQKTVSDLFHKPNYWQLKRGTSECEAWTDSEGTHYRDYEHYDDCTVSIRKGESENELETVQIGHDPICPNCGDEHDVEEWLCCGDCNSDHTGEVQCARCGEWIDEDSAIYCEDNDFYYCDAACANADDVYYCNDDCEWHTLNNCYYDDYDEKYYTNVEVITEDDHHYNTRDHAENDGYVCTTGDHWYPEDEVFYDEYYDEYYHVEDDTIEINGLYYYDAESARNDGYIECDGEWVSEDDVAEDSETGEIFVPNDNTIKYNELIFKNADNAKAYGLFYVNGEWTDEEEEVAA